MPLQIHYHEGQFCPVVVCDHCGEVISNAREGNYQWQASLSSEVPPAPIYFTHKHCCRAFEAARGGRALWMSIELQCLPIYLERNLKLDWKKANGLVDLIASLD
jgi:hypothetical protein